MNTSPETNADLGDYNERLAWLAPILVDLGVTRMEAELDGGGDEGALDEVKYYGADDAALSSQEIEEKLKAIAVKGTKDTALDSLHSGIEQDATDEGNWYDGDGGSVSSSYNVSVDGIFTEYVSISYHQPDEDYDDEDYDDDEEPEDDGMSL